MSYLSLYENFQIIHLLSKMFLSYKRNYVNLKTDTEIYRCIVIYTDEPEFSEKCQPEKKTREVPVPFETLEKQLLILAQLCLL